MKKRDEKIQWKYENKNKYQKIIRIITKKKRSHTQQPKEREEQDGKCKREE